MKKKKKKMPKDVREWWERIGKTMKQWRDDYKNLTKEEWPKKYDPLIWE